MSGVYNILNITRNVLIINIFLVMLIINILLAKVYYKL